MSPTIVLEILKANPRMPFKIVKSFILENLRLQQKRIDKHSMRLNDEMSKISNCKNEVRDMKQKPINFLSTKKTCDFCKQELTLPTIHFMCKHSYCEGCVDDIAGNRKCPKCFTANKAIFDIRSTFAQNRYDAEGFFRELKSAGQSYYHKSKFDVVAAYCSKDLFAGLNEPEPQ